MGRAGECCLLLAPQAPLLIPLITLFLNQVYCLLLLVEQIIFIILKLIIIFI